MRAAKRQLKVVLEELALDLQYATLDQARQAAGYSAQSTMQYMTAMDARFGLKTQRLGLTEASMFEGVQGDTDTSVLRRMEGTKRKKGITPTYSKKSVRDMEQVVQSGFLTRKPWREIREDLMGTKGLRGKPEHYAERILRTESMFAYNKANLLTMKKVPGQKVKILSATNDSRTGWDSHLVHGQIRRLGEAFQTPFGNMQHPPNRPNDREIVVLHRVEWPIPAYLQPRSDARVYSAWYRDRRVGVPPPRPLLTTVPLDAFGKG